MPAHSEHFPWPSHYGHYNFFKERMDQHGCVTLCSPQNEAGVYELTLKNGKNLRVFICECYSYSVAEYQETIDSLGHINAVIINSEWCGYSDDAKHHCRNEQVGLFKIKEFMAALNHADYWNYLTDSEKERFQKKGWL